MHKSIKVLTILLCGLIFNTATWAQTETNDSIFYDITLDDIVVTATKPMVKRGATGMVVSIDGVQHLQNKELDRILNACPGVKVSKSGEISINGIGGVTLMIGDKQLHLSGDQLISYLKSIQGSDLKNIEVISNPTSAYDAEGSGGVIRINLRRKTEVGVSGFLLSAYNYDSRSSFREAGGLAWCLGKVTLYGNYTYANTRWVGSRQTVDAFENGDRNEMNEDFKSHSQKHNYRAGLDWDVSNAHYVGFEYNGSTTRRCDNDYSETLLFPENNSIKAPSYGMQRPHSNLFTLNWTWKLDTIGSTLKFIGDYSHLLTRNSETDYLNRYYANDNLLYAEANKNQNEHETAKIWSAKLDYEHPFSKTGWKMASGIKFSNVVNDYRYKLLNNNLEDTRFTDNFHFRENLYAAYVTASYASRCFDANAGLRGEYTDRRSESYVKSTVNTANQFNLFPSVFAYWKPCYTSRFMVYYGMRIHRPDYLLLNPFTVYITDVSYKVGNPNLKAMIDNVIELTYVLQNKYYLALKGTFTKDKITDYSFVEGDATITSFANLNQSDYWYFSGYAPFQWGIWSGSAMLNLGWLTTQGNDIRYTTFRTLLSVDNYLKVTDNFGVEVDFRYNTPYRNVYSRQSKHTAQLDIVVDYSFADWMLSAGVYDIFNSTRSSKWHNNYPGLNQYQYTILGTGREFSVSLKYNFSTEKKVRERRKSNSNSEEMNRL